MGGGGVTSIGGCTRCLRKKNMGKGYPNRVVEEHADCEKGVKIGKFLEKKGI